jgi:hypothetical protein
MIIAHYSHRLPANYDTGLIRTRAKERGLALGHRSGALLQGFSTARKRALRGHRE